MTLYNTDPFQPVLYINRLSTFQVRPTAEAACSHVVELARVEVAANPGADARLRNFASIRLADAELAVHNQFKRLGLSSRVEVHSMETAGMKQFPHILFSSWAKYLLETGRFAKQLCGCLNMDKMRLVLLEFWARFQMLFPRHEIFAKTNAGEVDLGRTVPFYSHTDEGRSLKHDPLWILSCHGAIGRGSRLWLKQNKHKKPVGENEQGLNFIGNTFSNQFLICSLLRKVANRFPGSLEQIMGVFADDCAKLASDGVSYEGVTVWLVHIGTKGDLPALSKVGGFTRAFSNVPRRPSTKTPRAGICHMCLGGQEENLRTGAVDIPYEDMKESPIWEATMHTVLPWVETPAILRNLPMVPEAMRAGFFLFDLWHNFHLGIAKHWVACSLVAIAESNLLAQSSMEDKFQAMTDVYVDFCRTKKVAMWITEISRDTLNFPQSSAAPVGKWNKGSCSTTMMLFLSHYCTQFVKGKTGNLLLLNIATCPACQYIFQEIPSNIAWVDKGAHIYIDVN